MHTTIKYVVVCNLNSNVMMEPVSI
jgi:hypothetical protein